MNDSWIALVNNSGLTRLELESPDTLRFIQRRAKRQNAKCFWVVLTPRNAHIVKRQIRMGNLLAAFGMLQHLALHIGAIVPPDFDESDVDSEYVTIPDDRDREWNH